MPVVFGLLTFAKESFDRLYGYYVAKVQQRLAMLLKLCSNKYSSPAGSSAAGRAWWASSASGARALYVGKLHVYVYWFLLGVVLLWGFAAGMF